MSSPTPAHRGAPGAVALHGGGTRGLGEASRRRIPGLSARGAAEDALDGDIRGSTTILELLRMFPDGRAARLMSEIQFPCAHCGGAVREPLTLAAKRHRRDPRAVLEAFRALRDGYPDERSVAGARARVAAP
jgi:hypothetical protein